MGLVSALLVQVAGVGIGLVDITWLHRQEYFLGGFSVGLFQFRDEVHQFDGIRTSDIVNFGRHTVWTFFRLRQMVDDMHRSFGDVVDIGEVANHVTIIEHLDGLSLADGCGKKHGRHVWTSPRAVNGKEPKSCSSETVEFRIGMRHQFVALFRSGIETHRAVHLVILAVGNLFV